MRHWSSTSSRVNSRVYTPGSPTVKTPRSSTVPTALAVTATAPVSRVTVA